MTGSIEALFLAAVVFVVSHFALSLPQARTILIDKLDESGQESTLRDNPQPVVHGVSHHRHPTL